MINNTITSAARLVPPIGGFQEIGGRRIFLHRSGSGGPAVVFLPGASAVGLDYLLVQQQVSQFTTAVLYDRGGTGYSDPIPLPRTLTAVATELHELLHAQQIPAPYVLAPHSLGAFYAHRYAQLYPQEVAGLAWLDGLHRDWDDFMPPTASFAEFERQAPGPEQLDQLRPALRAMNAELFADYPEQVRRSLIEAKDSAEWRAVGLAERSTLVALAAELQAGPNIPDVPVVALSVLGEDPTQDAATSRAMQDGRTRMDAALVAAVSHGEQRILSDTVHHRLCFDRPDAVVQAIRDVIDRAHN
ncbi:alpha/beta fold hydrolase [Nocardia suismassiliense]|uniref:alpha/beta fold hydrolase n=1 Tax=Nocardia suismassiliense TaxID=2077092 RepID=UPI000D1FB005|nr:alpha/beta hydrolase [Nocardia suismassiliense]